MLSEGGWLPWVAAMIRQSSVNAFVVFLHQSQACLSRSVQPWLDAGAFRYKCRRRSKAHLNMVVFVI